MADLSDETLMAYADGVLDPAQREVVEAAIRDNPEYRTKVERFRLTLAPIRRAFEEGPLPEQPEDLITKLRRIPLPPIGGISPREPSASWQSDGRKLGNGRAVHLPTAIAASIALLIGVGLGWVLQQKDMSLPGAAIAFGEGGLAARGPFRQLLETVPSGTAVATASDGHVWQIKATFSFKSAGDAFCRRYEMINAAGARFAGYACRSNDGRWLVQAHVKSEGSTIDGKGFVPSGGQSDAALDAAIDAARVGDVLELALENKLIESAWQSSRR